MLLRSVGKKTTKSVTANPTFTGCGKVLDPKKGDIWIMGRSLARPNKKSPKNASGDPCAKTELK